MEKMKLLATLVCAFAVLVFANTARAQDDEAEVDWDEAIEFAEVTDTYVENNVEWVTYYDELQNVMWSQPADATPEAVKAYLSGDRETLKDSGLDDFCLINWPSPLYMEIRPHYSGATYEFWDFAYLGAGSGGAAYHKVWAGVANGSLYDVDYYIYSVVKNSIDYTDGNYNGRFWDQGLTPDNWDTTCDNESSDCYSGTCYYYVYEDGDVLDYFYPTWTCKRVARHEVFACDFWRYSEIQFCTYDPE
jgi:hypothetical protein